MSQMGYYKIGKEIHMKINNKINNKIIIFSIVFFIVLMSCNTVFGAIFTSYNNNTITLKDIAIESENYLIIYNPSNNMVELLIAPTDGYIGFDRGSNVYVCTDSNYNQADFKYHYCYVNNNIGGNWSEVSTAYKSISSGEKAILKKQGKMYPFWGGVLYDVLPQTMTWEDNFCIFYSNGSRNLVKANNSGVWVNTNNNGSDLTFKEKYNSTERITLDKYEFNTSTRKWNYVGTANQTNGHGSELVYHSNDIVNRDTGEVDYIGQKSFFFQTMKTEITQIAKVEELPKMITTILKLIIPIGLLVLSMVLMIYLIKSVISRMR